MKKFLTLFLILNVSLSWGQHLVSISEIGYSTAGQMRLISDSAKYAVRFYKVTYNTVNVDGTPTVASGGLAIPQNTNCDFFPLLSYNHGTVLHRDEVPSRNNNETIIPKLMASTGLVVLSPDYLGLGDNQGLHPYIHAETEATATIDMIRAVKEYFNDSSSLSLNGDLFITGYSQGGHAAMATVKYIQDNNLNGEFNVVAAGPASGPYNLSGSQQELLTSNQPYSNPGYVVYMLMAYQRVYGNLYNSYDEIFKSPYDQNIPPYFDGTYSMSTVNALLPNQISGFMQDSVLTNFKNDSVGQTHPLWMALKDNDNFNWVPNIPMELYYCTQDEQVDFQNSLDAEAYMQNAGANVNAVNAGNFDHGGCVLPSLTAALEFYKQYTNQCQKNVGLQEFNSNRISIYPNPARNEFHIEGAEETYEVKIYDISGKVILDRSVLNNDEVDVQNWPKGIYTLEIKGVKMKLFKKLVVE